MAATPPPGYTPPPADLPQRGDRATFSNRVDAWVTWFSTVILTQLAAMVANAYANALDAFASATAAAGYRDTALTYRNQAEAARDAAQGYRDTALTYRNDAQAARDLALTYRDDAQTAAAASANSAASLDSTSTTSLTLGTGSRVFTTQAGKQFTVGADVKAVSASDLTKYMYGIVTAYSGTTLTVNVTSFGGTGSVSNWNIMISGADGPAGAQGPAGGVIGGNLTGLLAELKSANIAAAATTNVWAAVGNSATLTGTTAVTSFGTAPQAGAKFTLIAGAATPLTNGANLQLQGGANYTTAVGDRVEIYAETTTQMRATIFKQDGTVALGSQYLKVSERQPSGTNAGANVGGDITQTRVFNTTEYNNIPGASLSSNQLTIPPGTYECSARAPVNGNVGIHRAFFYNVTDAAYVGVGPSKQAAQSGINITVDATVSVRFTIASTKVFTLRNYTNGVVAGSGLGLANSISGQPEIYSELELRKVN